MAERKHTVHKLFAVKGDSVERKNKSCPKCGIATFMGNHKDRKVCGKCGYTEKV